MKLFIVAALIAASSAARLEHLERQQQLRAYLPPSQGGFGSQAPFGAIAGAYGTAGPSKSSFNNRGSFPSASNQYLPPDHGPSASVGSAEFAGSITGFGSKNQFGQRGPQQYGSQASQNQFGQQGPQQYGSQASQFDAAPLGSSPFGAQGSFQSQYPSSSNQYFASQGHSSNNIPQQAFDEQTGYLY